MQLDALVFSREVLGLIEGDILKEAFRRIDQALYAEWQRTSPIDTESREKAWHKANGVKLVLAELEVMATPARTERNATLREQGESTTLRRPTIASSTA